MSLSFTLFTYLNVWWVMLFFVLPFGVERQENPAPHEYAAAPKVFHWKKKLLINSILSLVVTAIIALMINSGIFDLRD